MQNCWLRSSISSAVRWAIPKSRSMSLVPASFRKWNVAPSSARRADLVVMLITPLAARDPYSDAAAAPFTTSTLSMSSALMSGSPPLTMAPSTMYSGSCPRPCPFRDVTPRSSPDVCAPADARAQLLDDHVGRRDRLPSVGRDSAPDDRVLRRCGADAPPAE